MSAALWGALRLSPNGLPARYWPVLSAILIAAFGLRAGLAWILPNIHHADEVYQIAEQANRAVHGFGIVSWEFRTASRAAVLPTVLIPIFHLDVSVATRQMLIASLFSILSLLPVWVAFQWAGRLYGLGGGVLAAAMMATSLELVYFGPKPTPDALGGYFLLAALFLGRPAAAARATCLAGLCLMIALAIRLQIAPAVGLILLLMILRGDARQRMALVGGLASGLALMGAGEWSWWGVPFRGHWGYLKMEYLHQASAYFGREPLTFFIKNYVLMYGGAVPIVAFLVLAGGRSAPILLLTALVLVVPFHFVSHKEYRFLAPSIPIVVLLIALAFADFLARLERAKRGRMTLLVLGGWIMAMVAMAFGDFYRPLWTRDRNRILAFREIGRQADACGVALIGIRWWHTPGYSGLGRDIPIYEIRSDDDRDRLLAAANYVLVGPKVDAPSPPYSVRREYSRPVEHLYHRPGGCVPDAAAKVAYPSVIPGV